MTSQRDAVDALTKPVIETHILDGRVIVSELPPLLVQLEMVIRATMGRDAGSKVSTAFERNVLDSDALYEFMLIAERYRSWCRMAGFQPKREPVDDLLAWNDAVPEAAPFFIEALVRDAHTIRGKLEPSKQIEIDEPCPSCGALTWWDGEGAERPRPLVVTYLRDDPLGTVTAVCRQETCLAIWSGEMAVRMLRAQLDKEPDAMLAFLRNQA